jgi:hypothetical protein
VALVIGLDPLAYLQASQVEEKVLRKMLEEAIELEGKRKTEEIKAIGRAVANEVARLLQ